MSIRPVKRVIQSQPTLEGAGVRLRRAFGFGDTDVTEDRPLPSEFGLAGITGYLQVSWFF